jgi:hypothetical protein
MHSPPPVELRTLTTAFGGFRAGVSRARGPAAEPLTPRAAGASRGVANARAARIPQVRARCYAFVLLSIDVVDPGVRAARANRKILGRPKRVFRRDEAVRLQAAGWSWREDRGQAECAAAAVERNMPDGGIFNRQ